MEQVFLKPWLDGQKKDLTSRTKGYSKKRFLAATGLALLLLLGIFQVWLAVKSQGLLLILDERVGQRVLDLKSPLLNLFFVIVTILGTTYFVVGLGVVLVVFLVTKHRKRAAAITFLTLTGSMVLIYVLKKYFGRERPNGDTLSFPSGHASLSFYFYGLLTYLTARFSLFSLRAVKTIGLSAFLLVILISLSRIYLGFHFVSDIIGGFFLGGIWLLVAIILVDFLY